MTPAARTALGALAALGPAFALEGPDDSHHDDRDALRPLAALVGDAALLRARVVRARVLLGTDEDRVAASWVFSTIAARLVAPVIGAAVLAGRIPELRWRAWGDGLVPLRVVGESPVAGEPAVAVHAALAGPLATLADSVGARTRVAPGLLRGEAAVVVGKVTGALVRGRPEAAAAVGTVAGHLLARAPLAGAAGVEVVGGLPLVVRRSCCLAYRVPGGHTCADCPLGASRDGAAVIAGRR